MSGAKYQHECLSIHHRIITLSPGLASNIVCLGRICQVSSTTLMQHSLNHGNLASLLVRKSSVPNYLASATYQSKVWWWKYIEKHGKLKTSFNCSITIPLTMAIVYSNTLQSHIVHIGMLMLHFNFAQARSRFNSTSSGETSDSLHLGLPYLSVLETLVVMKDQCPGVCSWSHLTPWHGMFYWGSRSNLI